MQKMISKVLFVSIVLLPFLLPQSSFAKVVKYRLVATQSEVNISGKKAVNFALMINQSIPAPTLEFTEGDDAEIEVVNNIKDQELSIHWHGILLPPEMDGVPYVNTPPIKSGGNYVFRFRIRQNGTYWYHSHTNVQEQKGLYGAIVIHKKIPNLKVDHDVVAVVSDWSDENAVNILKNLRKDGDYYMYKKNTIRSFFGALFNGGLGTYLYNQWTRMGGMDFSDVGYDAFLFNGKTDIQLASAKSGDDVRVRVVNAAASTYFHLDMASLPMKVVAADGIDILPKSTNSILIGMAETYDFIVKLPDNNNYELRATAQDGTGHVSGWIGSGSRVIAKDRARPDLYAPMAHEAHKSEHEHGHGSGHKIDHHSGNHSAHEQVTVDNIQSKNTTNFSATAKTYELELVLGGDMERYIWHINGKAIYQDRTISVKQGEVVKFKFINQTMMHHPMHLHGHFFRVLNQFGDYSPMKHTVDVPPHGSRVIEFMADEPGEWMLHCHNLYHLKNGMARVVKYMSYTPKPEIQKYQKHDPHLHDHVYYYGMLEAATNHAQSNLRLSQTWNQLDFRIETRNSAGKNLSFNEPWEIEGDVLYRRWFNRFFTVVGGGTYFNHRLRAAAGVSYILPLLIDAQVLVNHRGKFRLDFEKRFQWTKNVFTDVDLTWRPSQSGDIEEPLEYEITLMYAPNWHWAFGLMLTEDNIGAGLHYQF